MFVLRQVHGLSMAPTLHARQLVLVRKGRKGLRKGDVVMIHHDGLEKVKRVQDVREKAVFLLGDNAAASTDSRHYGRVDIQRVIGKVVWPRI